MKNYLTDRNIMYRTFHRLLGDLKMKNAKADILAGYGVESTGDLTDGQLNELIRTLEEKRSARFAQVDAQVKKERSKCLRAMNELGVNTFNWENVNSYMLDKEGKLLYQLTLKELKALHIKLRNIKRHRDKKLAEEDFKAAFN